MAKLTDKQRKKIIAESVNGSSIRALAAKYGVSTTTIQRVLKSDTKETNFFEAIRAAGKEVDLSAIPELQSSAECDPLLVDETGTSE